MDGFAQYAVDEGIIHDTIQQRAAITKATVRAEFKLVATAGDLLGYGNASTFLNHSLQDHPGNLSYPSATGMAQWIAHSAECTEIVRQFKTNVAGTNLIEKRVTGAVTLNSTTDLHLSFNNVSYEAIGAAVSDRPIALTPFGHLD